jgi:hypothetical protein
MAPRKLLRGHPTAASQPLSVRPCSATQGVRGDAERGVEEIAPFFNRPPDPSRRCEILVDPELCSLDRQAPRAAYVASRREDSRGSRLQTAADNSLHVCTGRTNIALMSSASARACTRVRKDCRSLHAARPFSSSAIIVIPVVSVVVMRPVAIGYGRSPLCGHELIQLEMFRYELYVLCFRVLWIHLCHRP